MKIYSYDRVKSTQDLAREYFPSNEITAFVANSQTQGYGKNGRRFYSPSNTGIYFSITFPHFLLKPEKAGLLTLKIATELVSTLKQFFPDKNFQLKWVNDIYLNGKKVAGILTELTSAGLIVGVGLNVQTTDFPEMLKLKAGYITDKSNYDKNKLVSKLLEAAKQATETYDNASFLNEYRKYSNVIGKNITLQLGKSKISGKVTTIDDLGRLVIERDGQKNVYSSGEITKLYL